MAGKKATTKPKKKFSLPKLQPNKQQQIILGLFFFILGLALTISFVSFFFNWEADQSALGDFADREVEAKNLLSKFGAAVSDFVVYRGFGIASFILSILIALTGIYLFFSLSKKPLKRFWFCGDPGDALDFCVLWFLRI